MKKLVLAVVATCVGFVICLACLPTPQVYAHCQIPCGIYNDEVRFTLMQEHVTTIEKSMKLIVELSEDPKENANQLVRWTVNKEEHADAFIALPGGFGTLEEMLEVITLKQLQLHRKPIVFINILNFYEKLFQQFEHLFRESFAKDDQRKLYAIVADAHQAMAYIDTYQPPTLQKKWF